MIAQVQSSVYAVTECHDDGCVKYHRHIKLGHISISGGDFDRSLHSLHCQPCLVVSVTILEMSNPSRCASDVWYIALHDFLYTLFYCVFRHSPECNTIDTLRKSTPSFFTTNNSDQQQQNYSNSEVAQRIIFLCSLKIFVFPVCYIFLRALNKTLVTCQRSVKKYA